MFPLLLLQMQRSEEPEPRGEGRGGGKKVTFFHLCKPPAQSCFNVNKHVGGGSDAPLHYLHA